MTQDEKAYRTNVVSIKYAEGRTDIINDRVKEAYYDPNTDIFVVQYGDHQIKMMPRENVLSFEVHDIEIMSEIEKDDTDNVISMFTQEPIDTEKEEE
ncbi:hypothetical protein [Pseudobutyrivibrio sp.]